MDTISLCMIVRDEEPVLIRCLESAAGLYDELVIVYTGSADRTREIARGYTDKVYDFPWVDDFPPPGILPLSGLPCTTACGWTPTTLSRRISGIAFYL